MRFDEIDFEDEVLDGLYDMNFEEMTPVQEAHHSGDPRRQRPDRLRTDRNGQDGGLHAAAARTSCSSRAIEDNVVKTLDGGSHARAGHADRHPVAGILLLHARLDDGGLRRRRRPRLGAAEAGDAARRRRGDRHAGPSDRPLAEQRRRPVAREVFRARRGRPDARHGILRRHHDHRPPAARRAADADVLGYAAAQDPRAGQADSAQARRDQYRRLETQRGDRAGGLRAATKRRNWG